MKYVLDTGFFVISRNYYPQNFPSFWIKIDEAIKSEVIASVDQVKVELDDYGPVDHLNEWVKRHSRIFMEPSPDEEMKVSEILKVPEFQCLVENKKRLQWKGAADPFVIAKALVIGATVVTREKPIRDRKRKLNTMHIPDVCESLNVPWLSVEGFMQAEGWKF